MAYTVLEAQAIWEPILQIIVETVLTALLAVILRYTKNYLQIRMETDRLKVVNQFVNIGTQVVSGMLKDLTVEDRLNYLVEFVETELKRNNVNVKLDVLLPIIRTAVHVITEDNDGNGTPDVWDRAIADMMDTIDNVDQSTDEEDDPVNE